jgi:hypothetical protein
MLCGGQPKLALEAFSNPRQQCQEELQQLDDQVRVDTWLTYSVVTRLLCQQELQQLDDQVCIGTHCYLMTV